MRSGLPGRRLVALLAIAVLAVQARRFLPFIVDDAFISLRYAERLVEGKGLTWTDGERVEGCTNLLWVLCAAALRALGVDLVLAVRHADRGRRRHGGGPARSAPGPAGARCGEPARPE
ncbi:MAG: hypothetical protein HYS34_05890 [Acidobacteria bacterium]|nr:hypothetical protein [Acidobacteriota bacterium]